MKTIRPRVRGSLAAQREVSMRLRVMRHRAGLSQRQLAVIVGMDEGSYASRETLSGAYRLTFAELDAIVRACGFTVPEFFGLSPTIAECITLDLPEEFWPATRPVTT